MEWGLKGSFFLANRNEKMYLYDTAKESYEDYARVREEAPELLCTYFEGHTVFV